MPDSEPPRMVKEEDGCRVVSGSAVCLTLGSGTKAPSVLSATGPAPQDRVASPGHLPGSPWERQKEKLFEKFSVLLKSAL